MLLKKPDTFALPRITSYFAISFDTFRRSSEVNLSAYLSYFSMKAVIEEICAYYDYQGEIEYRPGRPADVQRLCADAKLARELLGFEPEVDFSTGLRETLDWYKVNQQ